MAARLRRDFAETFWESSRAFKPHPPVTSVHRRGRGSGPSGVQPSPMNLHIFLNCVFAKHTVQVLFLYYQIMIFYRKTLMIVLHIMLQLLGDLVPRPLPELCPCTPLGDFRPLGPSPGFPPRESLHCKILGMPMPPYSAPP